MLDRHPSRLHMEVASHLGFGYLGATERKEIQLHALQSKIEGAVAQNAVCYTPLSVWSCDREFSVLNCRQIVVDVGHLKKSCIVVSSGHWSEQEAHSIRQVDHLDFDAMELFVAGVECPLHVLICCFPSSTL